MDCETNDLTAAKHVARGNRWTRRDFLQAAGVLALGGALEGLEAAPLSPGPLSPGAGRLFPIGLPGRQWVSFQAAGFSRPACGVIYRLQDTVTNGMALGAIDTGCIDFETSGLLGYCTLFNSHVPRRGPIELPLVGLAAGGKTWALCAPRPDAASEPAAVSVAAWLPEDLGSNQPAWKAATGHVPGWFKSLGRSRFDLPAGRVACHTPAVLRWTSPIAGEVRLRGGMWLARNLGRNQGWELSKNGVAFAQGALAWGPTSAKPFGFAQGSAANNALTLRVEEGDVIELRLTPQAGVGDFVGVDLSIAAAKGDRAWDVARDWSDARNPAGPWGWGFRPAGSPAAALLRPQGGLGTARQIHYWGHYPVLDVEFDTDAPICVGMRAWAPFLPGDVQDSMIPGIVFEMHVRNASATAQAGTIALTFPGPTAAEAGTDTFGRRELAGPVRGVAVEGKLASYVLGVLGEDRVRLGGELGTDRAAWLALGHALPAPQAREPGACAAVDFSLEPAQAKVLRFVLTWSAPTWKGGGFNAATTGNTFTHVYARHYPDAAKTAELLARRHESLLSRVLAWQEVVYTDEKLPVWLRDSLVNVLYLIAEDGYWAQKKPPLPAWVKEEDGLFGMNECPRGCPQIECIPCSFYGSQPLAYFFPELQLSTIRGYQGYQYEDGAPPWIFGGVTGNTPPIDFAAPTKGYQWATNGISLAAIVDRFLLCRDTPDGKYARELYPMLKKSMIWTVKLRTTPGYGIGERIIAMPDRNEGTEWFEAPEPGWAGMTAHVGGLHLAQLRIVERVARRAGDADFARQCDEWFRAGAEAMEKRLWTGSYYRNYWEPETGKKSDLVFGYQLDGQWITDHHGLPAALPPDRVRTVLQTIQRCNVKVTRYGAVNYANPDGTPAPVKGYGTYSYFPPEALMLAMNYMYAGQKEFGLELARKVWHNLVCLQGYTWDMPNIMRGDVDTGERTFGNDYYQDMMLWSLPAAIEGQDFSAPARPGGLVDRMLKAARRPGQAVRSGSSPGAS